MTGFVNRRTAVIAVAAVGAVSAILLAVALIPNPVSAFGPGPWMHRGQYDGFGPGHFGPAGAYEANWTGSVPVETIRNDIIQSVKSKVNITIGEAEAAARESIGDGSEVFGVMLAPVNGYLVYLVHGIDSGNEIFRVVVDAGNGDVLESGRMDMEGFGPWKRQTHGGEMWR